MYHLTIKILKLVYFLLFTKLKINWIVLKNSFDEDLNINFNGLSIAEVLKNRVFNKEKAWEN